MNNSTLLKYCGRCNNAFECKPGNITQCQCYDISFTESQKKEIGNIYADCLCHACLLELSEQD
ncbi:MAG: cysteine-rich CWC family protein [Bacteroidota bacterium]